MPKRINLIVYKRSDKRILSRIKYFFYKITGLWSSDLPEEKTQAHQSKIGTYNKTEFTYLDCRSVNPICRPYSIYELWDNGQKVGEKIFWHSNKDGIEQVFINALLS